MKLLLEGRVDDSAETIAQLKEQLREQKLDNAKMVAELEMTREGAAAVKGILLPLYTGLRQLFGEFDAMGVSAGASSAVTSGHSPKSSAVWESWKKNLPGRAGEAIDALHVHGEMTAMQLRIHLKCGKDYIYQVIHQLHKAGLINKNGGKISLKEL